MTKEEFIKENEEILSKMAELRSRRVEIENEYISTNQPYPIGSKVKISYPDGSTFRFNRGEEDSTVIYGFVHDYEIFDEETRPIICRITKGGLPDHYCMLCIEWWRNPIVEICNE